MKYLLKALALAASCMVMESAAAQSTCSVVKSSIYYGNGVGRGVGTDVDAQSGKNRLNRLYAEGRSAADLDAAEFKIAFNHSAGALGDIVESARQTLGNEWPTLLVAFLLRDRRLLSLVPPEMLQRFNDFLTTRAIREMVAPPLANSDVARHIASYASDIGEGKKIVLVSHSQGNIFGNLAYLGLAGDAQPYFTMVPVASPESTARRSMVGHVRFSDDLVILGVELAKQAVNLPSPLAANDADGVSRDFLSHGFVDAYLADASARAFIARGMTDSINLLPVPPSAAGQGAITATLRWGANPDVDLHAFEPTGNHVYYMNKLGQFGELDVDDTTSFGPEHYVVSCQRLRDNPAGIGRYRIGVNYYYGSSAETAQVTIKTPDQERTFSTHLGSSVGSAGNASPRPVADVVVSKDPVTGRLDFVIEAR